MLILLCSNACGITGNYKFVALYMLFLSPLSKHSYSVVHEQLQDNLFLAIFHLFSHPFPHLY